MEDALEAQTEERQVLSMIYEDDQAFKKLSDTLYQYRIGEDGEANSIMLEFSWGIKYPSEKPGINLDMFYNNHLDAATKIYIHEKICEKAEQYVGMAMIYTLIDWVKDNLEMWLIEAPSDPKEPKLSKHTLLEPLPSHGNVDVFKKSHIRKDQLTKAQKRTQWNKCNGAGDKPRGWDWVDILKHLSKTGGKPDEAET